ncbi:MAG: 4Fe-4S binding protein [Chloroflexi bacterium]|nr:4Fe-4S binding protein [Chloroflexota bacterium]
MCHLCTEHGRNEKWYLNFENFLFDKIFATPEAQETAKEKMIATFAETEWRYTDTQYVRNPDYLNARAHSGFGAQIATYEEAMQILELANEATRREDSMMVVGHCPCTLVYRGTRDYVCIGFGMPVSMSMKIGYGRLPKEGLTEFGGAEWRELRRQLRRDAKVPLKLEEARTLLKEWERKGLWHLVMGRGRLPLIEAICNCERPYCTYWRYRDVYGIKDYCLKSHYLARIDPEHCTNCGACVEQCQFGAVHTSLIADLTSIDPTKCFGCGICRAVCRRDAISMVSRESVPAARNLW